MTGASVPAYFPGLNPARPAVIFRTFHSYGYVGRVGLEPEPPGLRTVQRGPLMLVYLTDVRGERVVIIQANWIG